MRLQGLELLPDPTGDALVRRQWQALSDAGLPSQADHRGPTNAPHVTAIAVPAITAADEARAVRLLGPLLPAEGLLSGVVVFGSRRLVLARTVEVDDSVVAAVLELRRTTVGHVHRGWLPHVTLAHGLRHDQVQAAVDVLSLDDVGFRLTALRRWDPEARTVTPLVPPARG